jgi:hypothetical protein
MSEAAVGLSTDRLARAHAAAEKSGRKRQSSMLSNGSKLLEGVDGRNTWVRRAKDLIREHTQDLGGPDNVSSAERSLVRRIAAVTVELESLEARFALAGIANPDDLALYFQGANNLRRLLGSIGLRRRSKDVTPTLAQYLDAMHQQQQQLDDEEEAAR